MVFPGRLETFFGQYRRHQLMNTVRRRFKHWLYRRCPGFVGVFPYFGERIHFPPDSMLFTLACEQGIFEHENLRLLQAAFRPNTWYFDIGANIGLMSAPMVHAQSGVNVVSVEASPRTAECLSRTVDGSAKRSCWHVVPKALGNAEGEVDFFVSAASHGVFDGMRDTRRGLNPLCVKIQLTTLDTLWSGFGKPPVSVVKIDVEGAEADVLRGGVTCLSTCRPCVLIEWNIDNLRSYGTAPASLLTLAAEIDYDVLIVPGLARIHSSEQLRVQLGMGETFLLTPRE